MGVECPKRRRPNGQSDEVQGFLFSQAVPAEFSARLYVDGSPQDVPGSGSMTLTLDRGEHQVYVELLDARKRQIIRTETVTFFVKQASVGFRQPLPAPRNIGR